MVGKQWEQLVRRLSVTAVGRRGLRPDRHARRYRPQLDILEDRLPPAITLSITNPAPLPEGDFGTRNMMFVVTRSGELGPAVQVDYATQNGTAVAGTDYVVTSGTLSFATTQTTATIAVPVIGNRVFQSNRTFTVALSNPRPNVLDFTPQRTFAVGNQPYSVAFGDVNGDGKPDLAIANRGTTTVSVLMNTTPTGGAVPTFADQRTFAVVGDPQSVMLRDLNGDSKLDLIVANNGPNMLSVLLNTTPTGATTPSFAPQRTYPVNGNPNSVAVGDFNGDGKPDIVVGNAATVTSTVSVFLNRTPTGATAPDFAPQRTFAAGGKPISVAVGDFNGDGKPDVAIANSEGPGNLSILLNTTPTGATTPTFAPQRSFAAGSGPYSPYSVTVGDFNGDGKPDLAAANIGDTTVSVLLNTTPTGATTSSFSAQRTFAARRNPSSVAVGDFNGDGKPDLAVSNGDLADITLGGSDNTVSVLLNTTPGGAATPSFAPQRIFATGVRPHSVAVGDVNGDGRPDLAVANLESATVSVLLNSAVSVTISGSPATGTIQDDDAPVAIAIAAGNNQTAAVTTDFATNLAVVVRNAAGSLVEAVRVTFTAPTTGPGGTFPGGDTVTVITNSSGQATAPTFTANTGVGSYTVTAQALGGTNPSVPFSLANTSGPVAFFYVYPDYATVVPGVPFDLFVFALDAQGQIMTEYTGEVQFWTSDVFGRHPYLYTFQPEDQGIAYFPEGVTLYTPGRQVLYVFDTATFSLWGSAEFDVVTDSPGPGSGTDLPRLLKLQPDFIPVGGTAEPADTLTPLRTVPSDLRPISMVPDVLPLVIGRKLPRIDSWAFDRSVLDHLFAASL